MALRLGDPEALVESLHGRHWATLSPDTTEDRLANAQEMLLAATGAGDEEAAFLARHARLHCFLELCDIAGRRCGARRDGAARRPDPPAVLRVARRVPAGDARAPGRTADRRRPDAGDGVRAGVRESEDVVYMYEDAQVFAIRWAQGRLEERRDRTQRHGELYPIAAMARRADRGRARRRTRRAGRGRTARAQRLLRPATGRALAPARVRARASVRADRRRAPRAGRSTSCSRRSPIDMRSPSRRCRSVRSRCGWGCSPTLLERWEDAAAHFRTAMERCDGDGRPCDPRDGADRARADAPGAAGSRDDGSAPTGCSRMRSPICDELGMPGIRERALRWPRPAVAAATSRRGHRSASLHREGQYWTIRYGAEMARLRDRKGLRHLGAPARAPGSRAPRPRAGPSRVGSSGRPDAGAMPA